MDQQDKTKNRSSLKSRLIGECNLILQHTSEQAKTNFCLCRTTRGQGIIRVVVVVLVVVLVVVVLVVVLVVVVLVVVVVATFF